MSSDVWLNRSQMAPLGRAVRAYAIPIDRTHGTVLPFDPSVQGQFDLDAPPFPMLDLGWVENFQRTSATKYDVLRTGPRSTATTQCRAQAEAGVAFDFPAWGKLQMAIAGGSQQMNVLASQQTSMPQGSGGVAVPAVYVQDGSDIFNLELAAQDTANFNVGDLVAVDWDYTGETGYVGSGAPAACLATPLDLPAHVDYIRRVSFNIGRVERKAETSLGLAQRLMGRVATGMGLQKIVAFVDREGSSFFQEWSGLFVVPGDSGGRICFFYPRLQAAASTAENRHNILPPVFGTALHASLRALPTVDPNDGETVLCYRSYFPAQSAPAY